MKEYSLDVGGYLGAAGNAASIYGREPSWSFCSPFSLSVSQLEKVIIVSIEDDPRYREIELQSLGGDFAQGACALLYGKDSKVHVYHSRGALLTEAFKWGENWEVAGETDIEASLTLSEKSVVARLKMTDRFSQVVEFDISQFNPDNKYFNLLAPLGSDVVERPFCFPIIYMYNFSLLRCSGAEISILVGGKARKPVTLPVRIEGEKRYHISTSAGAVLASWNRNTKGGLKPVETGAATGNVVVADDVEYTFALNAGHPEIVKIAGYKDSHKVYFQFSPPVPDLCCLKDGSVVKGRFAGGIDSNPGVMGGEYSVLRRGGNIDLTLHPKEGWQPMPGQLWLKSYSWSASLRIQEGGTTLETAWTL